MIRKLILLMSFIGFSATITAQYATLETFSGTHPRILTDAATLASLNTAIQPGNSHAALWSVLKPIADGVSGTPPTNKLFRSRGWELGNLVAAYKYSGDTAYLTKAIAIADTTVQLSDWLVDSGNSDLAMGHILHGMALLYDWCYDDLTATQRQQYHDALLFNIEKNTALLDKTLTTKVFWEDDYLGNHLYINLLGIASASIAIFDTSEDTKTRVFKALDASIERMDIAFQSLGDDGANIEGMSYFGYGIENLLMYVEISDKFFGTDLYNSSVHLKNIHKYLTYMHLPRTRWEKQNMHTQIGDNVNYSYGGTNFVARKLASAYNDTQMKWLAEEVDKVENNDEDVAWLNILWEDTAIVGVDNASKSTYNYFDDIGIVSSRSDWSGDESLFVFKCGPFLGHKAMTLRNSIDPGSDWGGAHAHPDANHFSIYAKEWLLEDDGYSWKYTSNHNTLMFNLNGTYVGQDGERAYFTDHEATPKATAIPKILKAESTDDFDYTVGDASSSYNPAFLTTFKRHIVFLKKENAVLVVDDVKQAGTSTRNAEIRYFTTPQTGDKQTDGSYLFQGTNSVLKLAAPISGAIEPEVANVTKYNQQNNPYERLSASYKNNANSWKNAVAFSWADKGTTPTEITAKDLGSGKFSFAIKNSIYVVDIVEQSVSLTADDDNDGIPNTNDTCPNTPENSSVDVNGCVVFSLPSTNFRVLTNGESCISSDNGSIEITAEENLNYTAKLTGDATDTKTFTENISFENLVAGKYKVCITVENQADYENCFNLTITEPEKLSVSAKVLKSSKQLQLKMEGAKAYSISVNEVNYSTAASEITIPLTEAQNNVVVKTGKDCQGIYKEKIILNSETAVFPNPIINNEFTLSLGNIEAENVAITIYTLTGNVVFEDTAHLNGGQTKINIGAVATGTYLMKANANGTILTYKITKK